MGAIKKKLRVGITGAVRKLPPPRDQAAIDTLRAVRRLASGAAPTPTVPATAPRPARTRTPTFKQILEGAYASGSEARIRKAALRLHELRARAEELAKPPHTPAAAKTERVSETRGVKSTQYMIDLLPHLQAIMAEHPRHTRFDVLDVGPGTGHGTALLAEMYRRSTLGYRMRVSALDIDDSYARYIATITPHVRFIKADIFDHDKQYDFVLSSHVIEHVPEPVEFCRRLQELARIAVLVSAPYNEPIEDLTAGHVNVIDEATVEKLGADKVTIMKSVSWGAFKNPPYDSVIAQLPGLAQEQIPD